MYKIKDIFDIANKNYNLKINKLDNTKEVTAIEKAIRRALKEQGVKAPYEVNKEQAYYLVNVLMKKYFLKKATILSRSLTKSVLLRPSRKYTMNSFIVDIVNHLFLSVNLFAPHPEQVRL